MREVVILIPDVEPEQNVEIDVRINGRTRTLKYRVELVNFVETNSPAADQVTVIRHKIAEYQKDWELVEIGAPAREHIPLMFRKKTR